MMLITFHGPLLHALERWSMFYPDHGGNDHSWYRWDITPDQPIDWETM